MEQLITHFPAQLQESIGIAKEQKLNSIASITSVVICGLGGSGIGGEIIKQWIQQAALLPVHVCHNYQLPAFVNSQTVVVACSYSGNTEETLTALNEAIDRGAHIIGVTSGGTLEKMATKNDFPVILIPGGLPPRAALAYPLVQLAGIFDQLEIGSKNLLAQIDNAAAFLLIEQECIKKIALDMLRSSQNKQFLFYAEDQFYPAILRACQQINENGKELAFYNVVPEMNHNEIVGWAKAPDSIYTVILRSNLEFARNAERLEFSEQIIRSKTDAVSKVELKGGNLIEQTLYAIHLVDWISFFIAEKKGIDVTEVHVIDQLKDHLSNV
jgi:glucose/mannose-6-phosphate isomerase